MKTITVNNARTQSIETAVEELSKRDSITMTEVREFMDDLVSQKIPTGEKAKYTDPNGEEHEYDVKIPISKIYKYKSDEVEILSRTEENILNNHDFTLEFTKDVKLSDWLKDLKDRSFFVAKEDVPKFVTWATRFARDIQNTCEKGEVSQDGLDTQNLQMQFNSVVKGCGKSYFIRQLVDGANELGIRARDEAPMPEMGRFGNTDLEARCLVLGYREHKPEVRVNEDVIMSIGRRESYPFEEKCKMKKTLQARAITIGSSNGFPYNKDDRSMTVIRCNSLKFQDYPEEIKKRASSVKKQNTTIYKLKTQISWISGFLGDLLEKNEFKSYINEDEQNPETQETLRLLSSYEISRLLIEVLSAIDDKSLLDNVSVAGLSKFYKKASGQELTFNQRNKIAELLTILYSKGLIQKTNYETNDLYKSYNLFKLSFIRLQDLTKEGVVTALQEVENAQKTWDDIIALAEKYENDNPDDNPPKKFLSDEPVEGDFPKNFLYKKSEYDTCPTTDKGENTQFVISNPPTKEAIEKVKENQEFAKELAKGENLRKCNFVFEIDPSDEEKAVLKTLSKEERVAKAKEYIEEQKRNVENLPQAVKDSIVSVTESGADSLHVILHTNNEHEESRREIWRYLSDKYFGGKADQQCSNSSRLTPNPNAIRNRKADTKPEFIGQRQNCWYFNKNPKEFDVKWIENQVLRDIEEDRKRREQRAEENYSRDFQHQELTVETLQRRRQSPARDNAISLLEGNCCHGPEAVSGMMYILSTGWDEYEMESVIDKGTWSQAEYDGMVKAAMNRLYK